MGDAETLHATTRRRDDRQPTFEGLPYPCAHALETRQASAHLTPPTAQGDSPAFFSASQGCAERRRRRQGPPAADAVGPTRPILDPDAATGAAQKQRRTKEKRSTSRGAAQLDRSSPFRDDQSQSDPPHHPHRTVKGKSIRPVCQATAGIGVSRISRDRTCVASCCVAELTSMGSSPVPRLLLPSGLATTLRAALRAVLGRACRTADVGLMDAAAARG